MIGSRVKLAKNILGVSIKEICNSLDISQSEYKKYISNKAIPNSSILIKLSNLTGFPIDFFFRGESKIKLKPLHKIDLSKRSQLRLETEVKDMLEDYIWLEEQLELKEIPPYDFEFHRYRVLSIEDTYMAAEIFKDEWGIGAETKGMSLSNLLEANGVKVFFVNCDEKFKSCAFVSQKTPIIAVRKNDCYLNQNIARELGHFMLEVNNISKEEAVNIFGTAFLEPYNITQNKSRFESMVIEAFKKEKISISKASVLLRTNIIEAWEIINKTF